MSRSIGRMLAYADVCWRMLTYTHRWKSTGWVALSGLCLFRMAKALLAAPGALLVCVCVRCVCVCVCVCVCARGSRGYAGTCVLAKQLLLYFYTFVCFAWQMLRSRLQILCWCSICTHTHTHTQNTHTLSLTHTHTYTCLYTAENTNMNMRKSYNCT
jgi:hypothetical protein